LAFRPGHQRFSILTEILPAGICVEGADLIVPPIASRPPTRTWDAPRRGRSGVQPARSCNPATSNGISPCRPTAATWCCARAAHRLEIGGTLQDIRQRRISPLYRRFADPYRAGLSDADASPLALVADALMLGAVTTGPISSSETMKTASPG
jgi:D-galactose 1-dehydrogenase/L-arabinose 1- dehydrogenase